MKQVPRAVILLALVHFFLFVYTALFRPMAFLLDDAYYSLTVSANIAAGSGITYGGFPTNGFQPLYSVILVPLFGLLGEHRMVCLKIALLFCGLCSTASIFLIYKIARRWACEAAALLAAMLAALSVNLFSHAASGLETALHAFIFLVVVDFYSSRRTSLNTKSAVTLGILLGTLALARLDACFVFIAIAMDRLFISRKKSLLPIKENLAIFLPAILVLAPWFIWNLATFGTIVQSSGQFHHWMGLQKQGANLAMPGFLIFAAIKLLSFAIKLPLEPLFGYHALVSFPAKFLMGTDKIRTNLAIQLWEKSPLLAILAGSIFLAAIVVLLFFGRKGIARLAQLRPLSFVLIALAGAAFYYPLYQLNYSMRHFYAYSLVMTVPVALFLTGLLGIGEDAPLLKGKARAVAFGFLILLIFRCGPFNPALPSGNEYGFDRIADIRRTVLPGSSIGYTDCGFYGYFLPEYQVVNLDGILNFEAQKAMEENKMSEYLVAKNIGFVLNLDNMQKEFKRQFETDMVSVLEKLPGSDFIYRVKKQVE